MPWKAPRLIPRRLFICSFCLDGPGVFLRCRSGNNFLPDVLMSDQVGRTKPATSRRIKDKSEDPMPVLSKIISRACFGLTAGSLVLVAGQPARAQPADTSFFVT